MLRRPSHARGAADEPPPPPPQLWRMDIGAVCVAMLSNQIARRICRQRRRRQLRQAAALPQSLSLRKVIKCVRRRRNRNRQRRRDCLGHAARGHQQRERQAKRAQRQAALMAPAGAVANTRTRTDCLSAAAAAGGSEFSVQLAQVTSGAASELSPRRGALGRRGRVARVAPFPPWKTIRARLASAHPIGARTAGFKFGRQRHLTQVAPIASAPLRRPTQRPNGI